ncbi:transposase [Candidatus Poribacteria bacterium]|nr:transposase [Candidatus Poribacteria bacterium]MYF54533.1 transposase [Candidatus Poribacteria bacterium]MYI93487.1 transposase [Candidatus Poribacteria bacterium]
MKKKRKKKQHRRVYKYQIREHPKNVRLGNMLDDLCDVHNHFMKLENRYYRIYGKYAGRYRLQPHLTKLLERTDQYWSWIPRDTLDAVIIRLHLAWERFFDIPGTGRPKFKRKGRYRSAKFQSGYKLEAGRVRLSFKEWDAPSQSFKFNKRWFSFHQHREWKGNVKYIQILRDAAGTYWLYVVTDNTSKEVLPATGESVGADFGMDTYLTLSTGEKIDSPQFLKHALTELRKRYKSLSRKIKGSNNWLWCVRQIARLYRHISNQRKDWHWKLATDLCRRFDLIVIETLNLDGMKRLWGRKVSDLSFGQFVEILKFKCFKHNREFSQVGQWTPTTKPCSDCGYQNKDLMLSDRQWSCPECGSDHDRDINAAINILRAACDPVVEQM